MTTGTRWIAVYVWGVIAAGAAAIGVALAEALVGDSGQAWLGLAALTVLAGAVTLRMSSIPASVSVAEIFTFTTALLFGPGPGTITAALDGLAGSSRMAPHNRQLRRVLFNAAAPAVAMWAAAHALFALADVSAMAGDPGRFLELAPPLAACAGIYFLLNTFLTALAVALEQGRGVLPTWREHFGHLWLNFVGGAYAAAILVICIRRFDYRLLAIAIPLPLILYHAVKAWLDRIAERVTHLEELNRQNRAIEEQQRLRHEAERALRERDEQLRAIFDNALDALILLDDDRRFVGANPAACQLLALPLGELAGTRLDSFLEGVLGPRWQRFVELGQEKGEWRIVRADGRRCLVEYTARAHVIPGRHLFIWRDVTQRRQLEDQLRQAQKMETVGRLAGGIAHDFNNLLTAIVGYSEAAAQRVTGPAREDIDEVLRASERATSLTRQLLSFSRKQVLQPTNVQLNQIVTTAGRMLGRLLGDNIELRTAMAPDLWVTRVDPGQIEQLIVNLAVNARDAMPSGGCLTLETANIDLSDPHRTEDLDVPCGRYVRLSVTDTGTGMDEVIKAHLFEPFFTTKERGKGTGLGLATVYAIVQQSGGHIRVDTVPGYGSTFRVYLPRVDGASMPAAPARFPRRLTGGSETILVAEDEPAVRSLVRKTLEGQGYSVLEARDGGEALAVAGAHGAPIDLLLTDLMMPVLDGRALARQLTARDARLKVIYMSGYSEELDEAEHERIDAYFQKPFSPTALTELVRTVLDAPRRVA